MAQATQEPRRVVEQVAHCKVYNDGTIFFGPVRASYPHVFQPYRTEEDGVVKSRFGIVGLFPKGAEPGYRPAKDLLVKYINNMIRTDLKVKDIPADKKFLRDGDLAGKEEYEGMLTISAGDGKNRPKAYDNRKDPRTGKPKLLKPGEDEDRIYAGCWVNVLIRPWAQNHKKWGKRVNANLLAVQYVSDDEPFGTGRVSQEAIEDTFDEFTDESGFDDDDVLGLGDEGDEL